MKSIIETKEYFNNKIEACMKIQELLRSKEGKQFMSDMEKAGYENFLEVSMFTNFYEIFTLVNSLYEKNDKLQGILKEHIAILDIVATLIDKVIELGEKNENTVEKSLKKMSDEVQKVKIDLQSQVIENLKPINESLKERIEEHQIHEEVNKAAKERKWAENIYG